MTASWAVEAWDRTSASQVWVTPLCGAWTPGRRPSSSFSGCHLAMLGGRCVVHPTLLAGMLASRSAEPYLGSQLTDQGRSCEPRRKGEASKRTIAVDRQYSGRVGTSDCPDAKVRVRHRSTAAHPGQPGAMTPKGDACFAR